MNQILSNHRSRAGRMRNFFAANNAAIAPFADIAAEISGFNLHLSQFDEFAARQQKPIKAYAQEKARMKATAVQLLAKWGRRCWLKAVQEGLSALAGLLNQTAAKLEGMDDAEGLNLMKDMRTGLNDNIGIFTAQGVTPAVISELTAALEAYEALINKPKEAITERKMDTMAIEALMRVINGELKNIVDLLEAAWEPDSWELIGVMRNNYGIDDLGHRYSGIKGNILTALPEARANYKVVCTAHNKLKEGVTNLVGEYKIKSMRPGSYEFKLLDPAGSVVKTAVIKIVSGVTLDYDWTV